MCLLCASYTVNNSEQKFTNFTLVSMSEKK